MIDAKRLGQANAVLAHITPAGCRFESSSNGLYFCWTDYRGSAARKRWVPTSRGSDYPSWRHRPFGGTSTVAAMELYRWARGLPVRPFGFWVAVVERGMNPATARTAESFGWPVQVPCVMCGRLVGNGVPYDHYDHDALKVPGPGCWYGEGCKGPK